MAAGQGVPSSCGGGRLHGPAAASWPSRTRGAASGGLAAVVAMGSARPRWESLVSYFAVALGAARITVTPVSRD